jgi:hypothetical protein
MKAVEAGMASAGSLLCLDQWHVDKVLRDEPHLKLVAAQNVAHKQVV